MWINGLVALQSELASCPIELPDDEEIDAMKVDNSNAAGFITLFHTMKNRVKYSVVIGFIG
ncbi:MAG: hypothetical protein ABIU11_08030 [Chitinophagaceae bacterium]